MATPVNTADQILENPFRTRLVRPAQSLGTFSTDPFDNALSGADNPTTSQLTMTQSTTIMDPNGGPAKVYIPTAVSASHHVDMTAAGSVLSSGSVYQSTIYVRSNGSNYNHLHEMRAQVSTTTSVIARCAMYLNPNTGQQPLPMLIEAGWSNVAATINSVGNGWWKIMLRGTFTPTQGENQMRIVSRVLNASNQSTYVGDGTSGNYIYAPTIFMFSQPDEMIGDTYTDTTGTIWTWKGWDWYVDQTFAKVLNVSSSARVFTYDTAGVQAPAAQVIRFDGFVTNSIVPVSWTGGLTLYDNPTAGSITGKGSPVYLRGADYGTAFVGTVVANLVDGSTTLQDSVGIFRLQAGQTTPVVVLSNEKAIVPASSDGIHYNLTTAGGSIKTYTGTTEMTTATVFGVGATGVSTATQNGLVLNINTATGVFTVVGPLWTTDSETFTLVSKVGSAAAVNKVYTVAKSRAIAQNQAAISVLLTSETYTASSDSNGQNYGTLASAGGAMNVYAGTTNMNASTTFYVGTGGTAMTITQNGLTLTMTTAGVYSLSSASQTAWTSTNEVFTLRAVYSGTTFTKTYSVAKSAAGIAGVPGAPGSPISLFEVTTGTGDMSIAGSTATKTAGAANTWDAGVYTKQGYTGGCAMSVQALTAGVGVISGLTTADASASPSYTDIDYAWYLQVGGNAVVLEDGVTKFTHTAYSLTDIYSVVYDNATIKYMKNGIVVYSHAAPIGMTLVMDSSFAVVGGSAAFGYIPMGSSGSGALVLQPNSNGNATVTGLLVQKTAGTDNTFNATAYSMQAYTSGCGVTWNVGSPTVNILTGLSSNPAGTSSYADIEYGIYCRPTGIIDIYESGTNVATAISTFTTADVFSVIYDNISVKYCKNGVPVYQHTVGGTQTFYAKTVLYKIGDAMRFHAFASISAARQPDRGLIITSVAGSSAAWSDTSAYNAIVAAGGIAPMVNDAVTIYYAASSFSQTKRCTAGGNPGTWSTVAAMFGGDVIVDGTLVANKIATNTFSSDNACTRNLTVRDNAGNIIFGVGGTSVFGNDWATNINLNPTWMNWTAAMPAGWTTWAGTQGAPTKELSVVTGSSVYACRWTATATDATNGSIGMRGIVSFTATPLPAGSWFSCSFTANIQAGYTGTARPGYLVRLFTNAAKSTYKDNVIQFTGNTIGAWQTVTLQADSGGLAIYGMDVYQMGAWTGFPLTGGLTTGSSVVFGPFTININEPVDYNALDGVVENDIDDRVSKSVASVLSSKCSMAAVANAGFVAGTLQWNSAGVRTSGAGTAMTPGGLIGYNSSGVRTFYIDSAGNANFAGTLAAGVATKGASFTSSSSATVNGITATSLNTGIVNLGTYTASGTTSASVQVSWTVTLIWAGTSQHTVQFTLTPTIDGTAVVNASWQPESMVMPISHAAAGQYQYQTEIPFSCTYTTPSVAGAHAMGFIATSFYSNSNGGAMSDANSTLYAYGTIVVQENLA